MVECARYRGNKESVWVVLNNGKVIIRIGLIYTPQESRTKKNQLKKSIRTNRDCRKKVSKIIYTG